MEVVEELRRCFVILVVLSSIVSGHIRKPPIGSGNVLSGKLGTNFKKGVGADCVDTITCGTERFVAKCTYCDPRYFYCASAGASPFEKQCPAGQLFNPDPYYARCILSGNCPYHPYPVPSTTKSPDPTALTTKGSCVDTVICTTKSFIAKCSYCDPRYFYCSGAGAEPLSKTCPSGQMFNPDPYYAKCILTDNCPYHPPWISTTTSTSTSTSTTTTTTVPSTTTTTSTSTTTVPSTTTTSTTTVPSTTATSTTTVPSTTAPSTTAVSSTTAPSTTAVSSTTAPSTTAVSSTTAPSTTTVPSTTAPSTTAVSSTNSQSSTSATTSVVTETPTTSSGTTGTSSSMVTSTVSTITPGCLDTLNCTGVGDFPRCTTCNKDYFFCKENGAIGITRQCENGYLFNLDPAYPHCVSPSSCPYHPEPTLPPAL